MPPIKKKKSKKLADKKLEEMSAEDFRKLESEFSKEDVKKIFEESLRSRNMGECLMCGAEYEIKKEIAQYQRHEFELQPCPKCHYDPNFEKVVKKTIDSLAEFTIRAGKVPIGINSDELSEEIVDVLKKYWPKPK